MRDGTTLDERAAINDEGTAAGPATADPPRSHRVGMLGGLAAVGAVLAVTVLLAPGAAKPKLPAPVAHDLDLSPGASAAPPAVSTTAPAPAPTAASSTRPASSPPATSRATPAHTTTPRASASGPAAGASFVAAPAAPVPAPAASPPPTPTTTTTSLAPPPTTTTTTICLLFVCT